MESVLTIAITLTATTTMASVQSAGKEGTKDGEEYARDLRARGIEVDRIACAVGMTTMDSAKPHYSQAEIEAYLKAFGNACIGRKIL